MILIDAGVAIAAYDSSNPRHSQSRSWFEATLGSAEPVAFSLIGLLAFLRIMTNSRVYERPMEASTAIEIIESWLARPNVIVAAPTGSHWPTLRAVAADGKASAALLMDAHLATLALEHGATLATADRDFRRFSRVRLIDPTAE